LLAEGAGQRPDAGRITDSNAIKHDASGGHTLVVGACRAPVKDAATAAELVARASAARACEATAMNAVSSRSHVVFMLYIKGVHALSGAHLQGCLCLVDLAGRWVTGKREGGCSLSRACSWLLAGVLLHVHWMLGRVMLFV
jgi:hypothetical protein